MSVCLSVRKNISGTARAIFTKFLCMLPIVVAPSVLFQQGDEIPREQGNFAGFFLIYNALYNVQEKCVSGDDREGRGTFGRKRARHA